MTKLRVGIVGTGLIGGKRADALTEWGDRVAAVADKDVAKSSAFAQKYGAESCDRWETLVCREDLDAVVVATSNDSIPPIAMSALESGKHVFVEKPAGRFPSEVEKLVSLSKSVSGVLAVGFNHRFHPAVEKAFELLTNGKIGVPLYLRARYGHGGRIGYDREWRADSKIAGGGELLDQGVHLIDLSRWFFGEMELENAMVETFFWDMPVEDNGVLVLKSREGKNRAMLHASCTEWKNLFDFEIYGDKGKLQITGLGGSYGPQQLKLFSVPPQRGVPELTSWDFPGPDLSWKKEWEAFRSRIDNRPSALGTGVDALRALEIIHSAYRKTGKTYAKP